MTVRKTRMTAAERREREERELVEKQMRWLGMKERRMLIAIARAQELGFEVRLETLGIYGENVRVKIGGDRTYTMQGLEEWEMATLESELARVQAERDAEATRDRRRQELLARLTEEERELLGF